MPHQEVPVLLKSVKDFILHFLIYAVLSILILLAKTNFKKSKVDFITLVKTIVFCFVFGLSLEIIQEFVVSGRHFQISDVVFNSLGTLVIWPINSFLFKPVG